MEKIKTVLDILAKVNKFLVALLVAGATLSVVAVDGVTVEEWVQIAIAFAGALGVYAVPNKK